MGSILGAGSPPGTWQGHPPQLWGWRQGPEPGAGRGWVGLLSRGRKVRGWVFEGGCPSASTVGTGEQEAKTVEVGAGR